MSLRPPTTAGGGGGRREMIRKQSYKVGVDVESGRRRREENWIEIRKNKREDSLNTKRRPLQQQQEQSLHTAFSGFRSHANNQPHDEQLAGFFSKPDQLDTFRAMIQDIWSNYPEAQLGSTTKFRKLLSVEHDPPIDEVIKSGVVPRFMEFLARHDLPRLQFEAAWCLTNIASGTTEHTRILIEHGAVPVLVQALSYGTADVREQVVWALGNIAGDSQGVRDYVISQGALVPLLSQFNMHSTLSMLRNATWTLSNFFRGDPEIPFEQVRLALSVIQQLINSTDEEVLSDACWALSHISNGTNEKIQAVIETGVCPRLVFFLLHPSPTIHTPSLRTIGNIVTGDDAQTQAVIDCQVLYCFHLLLTKNYSKSIKKETCWAISNITAGNVDQIQAVIQANIIGPVVHLLRHAEFATKKEAAWAITNASSKSDAQIRHLVEQGCISPLCDLLTCPDSGIVMVCLEGLENILRVGESDKESGKANEVNIYAEMIEECEGLDKIEVLQNHDNTDIYEKAVYLLETYWNVEEDEEEDEEEYVQDRFDFGTFPEPLPLRIEFPSSGLLLQQHAV